LKAERMPRAIKNVVILAMSPTACAQALGLSETVVQAAIANGDLGPVYIKGAKHRLLVSDIEKWVRSWKTKKSKG
jgi:predicted regulator of Ras-like GTPase activity (Roadblock/LC7/MglB family)